MPYFSAVDQILQGSNTVSSNGARQGDGKQAYRLAAPPIARPGSLRVRVHKLAFRVGGPKVIRDNSVTLSVQAGKECPMVDKRQRGKNGLEVLGALGR
jgi:hypothetical protein